MGVEADVKFSTWELIKHSLDDFKGEHVRALFSTRLLAYSTTLIIVIYGARMLTECFRELPTNPLVSQSGWHTLCEQSYRV